MEQCHARVTGMSGTDLFVYESRHCTQESTPNLRMNYMLMELDHAINSVIFSKGKMTQNDHNGRFKARVDVEPSISELTLKA